MKCQILSFRKNKENYFKMSSAEFIHSTESVKTQLTVINTHPPDERNKSRCLVIGICNLHCYSTFSRLLWGATIISNNLQRNSAVQICGFGWLLVWSLTLKAPRKPASENIAWLYRLLHLLANFSNILFAYRQTVWTQIRLLLEEQSDLSPHCLQQWLLK